MNNDMELCKKISNALGLGSTKYGEYQEEDGKIVWLFKPKSSRINLIKIEDNDNEIKYEEKIITIKISFLTVYDLAELKKILGPIEPLIALDDYLTIKKTIII